MHILTTLLLLLTSLAPILAATPNDWRSRSIYQVLTDRFARTDGSTTAACNPGDRKYCGGTWRGLINHLDYIKDMGFTAVWISPITAQGPTTSSTGESYHGYWQSDIYSLNSHFGSPQDLRDLSTALHARGMYLMVDIVVNHYFWAGPASSVSYSTFNPFNSATYFHPFCSISQADYDNNNQGAIENCWLGNEIGELPDLNTENAYVVSTFNSWISSLVSNYSIDGLRVDTVKHVPKSFWPNFNTASRVYNLGEVYHGDPGYTCPYQNYMDGVLNFPLYYSILDAFRSTSGSISSLVSKVNSIKTSCKDSNLLGSFTENHDIPRLPSYTSDLALLKNAIAFGLLADGVPIIYSGQESLFSGNSDPYNREALWSTSYSKSNPLYGFIALINQLRNIAISRDSGYTSYKSWIIYSDTTTLVTRKGSDTKAIIAVFSNKGSNGAAYTQSIPNTGYTSGTTIVEILGCTQKVVNSDGSISVDMAQGALRVFYPKSLLSGSGVCGN